MVTSKSSQKHPSIAKLPNYKITLDMQSFINSKENRHNTIDEKEVVPGEELRRVSKKKKSKSKSKNRRNTDYVQVNDAKYRAQSNTSGRKYNSKDIRYQDLYSIYRKSNVDSSGTGKYYRGKILI